MRRSWTRSAVSLGAGGHLNGVDVTPTITASFNEGLTDHGRLFKSIQEVVAKNRDADHEIYVAGEPVVRGYGYYYFPAIVAIFV